MTHESTQLKEQSMQITMRKDKETKNSVRYAEEGSDNHAKNIYLLKTEAKELGDPAAIVVTIEAAK